MTPRENIYPWYRFKSGALAALGALTSLHPDLTVAKNCVPGGKKAAVGEREADSQGCFCIR